MQDASRNNPLQTQSALANQLTLARNVRHRAPETNK